MNQIRIAIRNGIVLLLLFVVLLPLHHSYAAWTDQSRADLYQESMFDPAISVVGELAPNALGLPGERITWVITVVNAGAASGTDIVIRDTLRDEVHVDSVEATSGKFAIDGQTVEFNVPMLEPGESAQVRINTTLLRGPVDGLLVNQVRLTAVGPAGSITDHAMAEVPIPVTLPATGYPPEEDLPGQGEPSVEFIGLMSIGLVMLTAFVVWLRGSRSMLNSGFKE